ncbi:MAG: hypothetical protein DWH94_12255, partial [Planctomycetota bacterium]
MAIDDSNCSFQKNLAARDRFSRSQILNSIVMKFRTISGVYSFVGHRSQETTSHHPTPVKPSAIP